MSKRTANPRRRTRRAKGDQAPERTPNAYGYARVNTGEPTVSVAVQAEMIEARVKRFSGVSWIECVREDESPVCVRWNDRPKLMWLLAKLQRGDVLVVYTLDRLELNTSAMIECVNTIIERGIRFIVLQFGGMALDLETTTGRIFVRFMQGMAKMQTAKCRTMTRAALQWRKANGYATTNTPFGFKKTAVRTLDNKKCLYVWLPIDIHVIEEICTRMDRGETATSIGRSFEQRGVTCDGQVWAPHNKSYGQTHKLEVGRILRAYEYWRDHPDRPKVFKRHKRPATGERIAETSSSPEADDQLPGRSPFASEQSALPLPLGV